MSILHFIKNLNYWTNLRASTVHCALHNDTLQRDRVPKGLPNRWKIAWRDKNAQHVE